MAGTLTSLPFDVIRTRMVAQPETDKMYLSVRDAALKLKSEGGIRAFYKGKIARSNFERLELGFFNK